MTLGVVFLALIVILYCAFIADEYHSPNSIDGEDVVKDYSPPAFFQWLIGMSEHGIDGFGIVLKRFFFPFLL